MNFMHAPPSAADLLARYAQLPPGPKLILRLKSLTIPQVTKSEFIDCMRATGRRTQEGKAWSPQLINAMFDELRRQGLLTDDLACLPALVHPGRLPARGDVLAHNSARGVFAVPGTVCRASRGSTM